MQIPFFTRKQKFLWRDFLRVYAIGFGMGAADIVPGVSGGTIAFIFGIYEELIYSIKTLSGQTLALIARGRIAEAVRSVPYHFLIPLGLGIGSALATLARLLSLLLRHEPVLVWSFFFGLVLASILIVRTRVIRWDWHDYAAFIGGATVAFIVVGAVPTTTPATMITFFASGAVASVAMILPGISGSFLLLIMGKYEQILSAVVAQELGVLTVVALGAAVGLAVFSRILSWMFARHHDVMIATLAGVMLGSLRKIWPWKQTIETRINSSGEVVPFLQENILPTLDVTLGLPIVLGIAAFVLMYQLDRLQILREQTGDIEDHTFSRQHKQALKRQRQ